MKKKTKEKTFTVIVEESVTAEYEVRAKTAKEARKYYFEGTYVGSEPYTAKVIEVREEA